MAASLAANVAGATDPLAILALACRRCGADIDRSVGHHAVAGRSFRRSYRRVTKLSGMTEAVIVATARSPIGRAVKGSLVDLRPDDMAAQIVAALMEKVPEVGPSTTSRT